MPTNDERREVAARLRWIDAKDDPGNTALMLDKIRRAIGVHMNAPSAFPPYEWLVTYAHVTLNRLADLIEPEERTCHMRDASWDDGRCTWGCICSECGAKHEHELSVWMNFCPFCGAKVVKE